MIKIDKKVVAFWSPVSRTGKSTILANCAIECAKNGMFVGIIELNKQIASLPNILNTNIPNDKSLVNAVNSSSDSDILRNFVKHDKYEDLYLLSLNDDKDKIDDLHKLVPSQISNLITICREKFDIIFLDIPSSYFELTPYEVLKNHAEKVVVVLDNDINSIKANKKYELFYSEVNIDTDSFVYVMNKDQGIIDVNEIEKNLNIKIKYRIPNKTFISKSTNEGDPIVEIVPSNKAEKLTVENLKNLTNEILDFQLDSSKNPNVKKESKKKNFSFPFLKRG